MLWTGHTLHNYIKHHICQFTKFIHFIHTDVGLSWRWEFQDFQMIKMSTTLSFPFFSLFFFCYFFIVFFFFFFFFSFGMLRVNADMKERNAQCWPVRKSSRQCWGRSDNSSASSIQLCGTSSEQTLLLAFSCVVHKANIHTQGIVQCPYPCRQLHMIYPHYEGSLQFSEYTKNIAI